ncbi:MAG: hypothetical protein ACI815_001227 [Psychroserpens sp.]|jgi:hypothetical protein
MKSGMPSNFEELQERKGYVLSGKYSWYGSFQKKIAMTRSRKEYKGQIEGKGVKYIE